MKKRQQRLHRHILQSERCEPLQGRGLMKSKIERVKRIPCVAIYQGASQFYDPAKTLGKSVSSFLDRQLKSGPVKILNKQEIEELRKQYE